MLLLAIWHGLHLTYLLALVLNMVLAAVLEVVMLLLAVMLVSTVGGRSVIAMVVLVAQGSRLFAAIGRSR